MFQKGDPEIATPGRCPDTPELNASFRRIQQGFRLPSETSSQVHVN